MMLRNSLLTVGVMLAFVGIGVGIGAFIPPGAEWFGIVLRALILGGIALMLLSQVPGVNEEGNERG